MSNINAFHEQPLDKCTFSLGYIRQPVYACKTCLESDSSEPAGMCYGCSVTCHATHELFELFPKRQFRCDCGLPGKLNKHHCSFMIPAKKILKKNDKNQYNHNFEGRYCRCDNQYDPGKDEHVMHQCIACEDWFHQHCIGNIPEEIEDFDCYVCRTCTKKYPFLLNKQDTRFSFGLSKGDEPIHTWMPTTTAQLGDKRKASESIENCQNVDISTLPEHDGIELFLQTSWRDGLCSCLDCMKNYKKHQVEYLLEEEKTYEPEEEIEKSILDIGLEQLQQIDRVKAIESLQVYKSMANDVQSYLASFEASGKILTQQDLENFFNNKCQERKE